MRPLLPALLLLLPLIAPLPAQAVVISTGDGSGNTSAPPDDPGFANVGVSSNFLTGVYLRDRWVLTAAHVGPSVTAFSFDGISYPVVPDSRVLLSKDGTPADLALFRLEPPGPPLPQVTLARVPIKVDELVTMIGNGWNRAAAPTCWTIAWAEIACPGGVYEGFERIGPRTLRWGLNRVVDVDIDVPGAAGRLTRSFELLFDADGEPDEAQLVTGDSGGASFVLRDAVWELAGIHFAMIPYPGQPADTALFGNSSLDADTYHYLDEIEEWVLPPKIPALPWPAALLGAAALLGVARTRLVPPR